MFAYDYPLLSVFWTVLWIYLIFAWFMLLFSVIADIFRNHEMRGFSKAIWLVVVILLSVLASFIPARNASRLTVREVLAYE